MKNQVKRPALYLPVVLSLILLFNPNFFIVDVLPDFIAFALLAAVFRHAADCAPYFEEARSAMRKLFWVGLLKLPALLLVFAIRSKNTMDNDTIALFSLVFATAEIVLSCIAVHYLFDALFRLGERTDARALISGGGKSGVESLRSLSYLFFIVKNLCAFLPSLLLLTRTEASGSHTTAAYGSRFYPVAVAVSTAISLLIGIVWLVRMLRYAYAVHKEGHYADAIDELAAMDENSHARKNAAVRMVKETMTLMIIASVFSIEFSFSDLHSVDLLPSFLLFSLLLVVVRRLCRILDGSVRGKVTLLFGAGATLLSLLSYITRAVFLENHSYADMGDAAVRSAYLPAEVTSVLSLVFTVLFFLSLACFLSEFTTRRTGISPDSALYMRADRARHTEWRRRSALLAVIGSLTFAAQTFNVFRLGHLSLETAVRPDGGEVTIAGSVLPWFVIPMTLFSLLFIGYTWYYCHALADDCEVKITEELP